MNCTRTTKVARFVMVSSKGLSRKAGLLPLLVGVLLLAGLFGGIWAVKSTTENRSRASALTCQQTCTQDVTRMLEGVGFITEGDTASPLLVLTACYTACDDSTFENKLDQINYAGGTACL